MWDEESKAKCLHVLPNYSVTVLRPPTAPRLYPKTFRKLVENLDRDSWAHGFGSYHRKRSASSSECSGPRKKPRVTREEEVKSAKLAGVPAGPLLMDLPGELLMAAFGLLDLPKQIRISRIFKDQESLLYIARLLHLCVGPHIRHLIFKPHGMGELDLLASEEDLFGLHNYLSLPTVAPILFHLQIRLDTLVIIGGKPLLTEIVARDDSSRLVIPAVTKKLVLLHSKIGVDMHEYGGAIITREAKNATFSFANDGDAHSWILKTVSECCGRFLMR